MKNRFVRWLFAPTKLPPAPPFWVVFFFGTIWNLCIQCWWAAALCLIIAVVLYLISLHRK